MELLGLDSALQPVQTLRCIHIQWNRRYREAGDFLLQLRAEDFDSRIAYVYTDQRPETGMVQKLETEHTVKGDFVLVSGFFLEGMLNWKVLHPRAVATGNAAELCRALMRAHLPDTGVTVPDGQPMGGDAVLDVADEPLGDATYALLRGQGLGQRIRLNYADATLRYEVWQGMNRTQSQSVNAFAVFSQQFGTVDTLTLTRDHSDRRNFAIALYEGGELTVDVRASATEPKRALCVDTGINPTKWPTQAAMLAAVESAARAELQKRGELVNIEATVLQNNSFYRRDYDLGDLCDVRDDRLRLAFEARIIEVSEVWKENTHTVTLQFGDKIPTVYQRRRV